MILCCEYIIAFCRCSHLSAKWEELKEDCKKRAAHLSKAITREQVRDGTYMDIFNI